MKKEVWENLMKRNLLLEFEEMRKELMKKGAELGFQHPFVLELSRQLDIIHNEILKNETNKKNEEKDRDTKIFEKRSPYLLFVCAS